VYEQLSGLCMDASWLKSYMASALLVSKETFQATALALGPTKQPLPSFGLERAAVKTHGAVASNEALAAEMPKVGGLGLLLLLLLAGRSSWADARPARVCAGSWLVLKEASSSAIGNGPLWPTHQRARARRAVVAARAWLGVGLCSSP
jgi:hypothetical protein